MELYARVDIVFPVFYNVVISIAGVATNLVWGGEILYWLDDTTEVDHQGI